MIGIGIRDVPSHDDVIHTLTDPETLRERANVPVTTHTVEHDDRDHCSVDIAGRVAVGVIDEDGRLLLLVNDDLGIALLPHGSVADGDDWAETVRREVEGQTGFSIALESVEHLREMEHVVEGEPDPHARTFGVIFAGVPTDGSIRDCKQTVEAGSDDWRAGWFEELPAGIEVPEGGPGEDLALFLE